MDDKLYALRKLLTENSLDAVFISSIPTITYLTGFAGFSTIDRDAFLLITNTSQYIFTHGIYREDVKRKVKHFKLVAMTRENPISESLRSLIETEHITKLGFEAFDLRVTEYDRLTKHIDKKILQQADLIKQLRKKKTPEEIASVKKACAIGDQCYSETLKKVKLGMTENELAAHMEFFIKSQGAEVSFPTIVAFGENAAHPHHMPTDKKLERNSFVLLDFGVLLNGYCSDMTRTVFFGSASQAQEDIYETVLTAQQKAIQFIEKKLAKKEIVRAKAVDKIARDYMIEKGYPSIPHSLGHGIGIEVHESPRLTPISEELLEEGAVFSIEPGIYLPDNMGIRIEDLFAIKDNKLVRLTSSPREFIEI